MGDLKFLENLKIELDDKILHYAEFVGEDFSHLNILLLTKTYHYFDLEKEGAFD